MPGINWADLAVRNKGIKSDARERNKVRAGACVCGAMVTMVNTETRRKDTVITNDEGS